MAIPRFLLRKLYKQGSLRQIGPERIRFSLQNVLADATVVAPPRIVINGVTHAPGDVLIEERDLASISTAKPFPFTKGDTIDLTLLGHLLRGGNRIHITVETEEYGTLEIFVEDREQQDRCDVPEP